MNGVLQALLVALPPAYLAVAMMYGMAFAGERQPAFARHRRWLLLSVLLAHGAVFVLNAEATGAPLTSGMRILSATSLTVGLLFVLLTWRSPQPTVAALLFAIVFLMQLVASAAGPIGADAPHGPQTPVQASHAVTMLLATAALVLSGIYGSLHLILYRRLRAKAFGPVVQRLPDLEQLARTTRQSALAGFLFLTLGVNVGIGLAHARGVSGFRYSDPTVLLYLGLWVHFGIIAFSRRIRGFNARKASIAAMGGLVTLLVAMAVLAIPGATFHTGS